MPLQKSTLAFRHAAAQAYSTRPPPHAYDQLFIAGKANMNAYWFNLIVIHYLTEKEGGAPSEKH